MSRIFIEVDNKELIVPAEVIKGQLWIHLDGQTFVYQAEPNKGFSKASKKAASGKILSPMPGKITQFFKNKGDLVKSGEPVLVMEAMKMEYTLKSDKDGVLQGLSCSVGDQVPLGKLLVEII